MGRVSVAAGDKTPPRRRAAGLSWLSAALIGVTIGLLLLAAWVALRAHPKDIVGQLPLGADDNVPAVLAHPGGRRGCGRLLRRAGRPARRRGDAGPGPRPADPAPLLAGDAPAAQRCADSAGSGGGPAGRRSPSCPPSKLPDDDGASARRLRLTVLVPAHDEALTIGATLESLWGQTRPPDRVVVVADNCTDDTADIAREHGAEVFTTVGNTEKKAGALNQALSRDVRRHRRRATSSMVMDADSVDRARSSSRRRWDGWRPTPT